MLSTLLFFKLSLEINLHLTKGQILCSWRTVLAAGLSWIIEFMASCLIPLLFIGMGLFGYHPPMKWNGLDVLILAYTAYTPLISPVILKLNTQKPYGHIFTDGNQQVPDNIMKYCLFYKYCDTIWRLVLRDSMFWVNCPDDASAVETKNCDTSMNR